MALLDRILDQSLGSEADATDTLVTEPGWLLNTVLVEDRRLAALDRAAGRPLEVTVVNSTGAGGITALAGRSLTNCRTAAVQTAVRDLADPVGNIARIAAAARELDPGVTVLVDIPDGFGFEAAVTAAEAEGLTAVTGLDAPARSAARLSGLIEADLRFVVDGISSAAAMIGLLTAVDSLVDGAEIGDAAALLAGTDDDQHAIALTNWNDDRARRVRRRLGAVRTLDVPRLISELAATGLITI